jgi:hypothetical protein
MMTLTFDEASHAYLADGQPVPSVTQILKAAGFMGNYRGTKARDRGTLIHKATEAYDALGIVPGGELEPYVKAWAAFLAESKGEVLASEQRLFNERHWYAGTLDRILLINGQRVLVDIKSGSPADWHRLQLGAYDLAAEGIESGLAVYVRGNGRYTTRPLNRLQLTACGQDFLTIREAQR